MGWHKDFCLFTPVVHILWVVWYENKHTQQNSLFLFKAAWITILPTSSCCRKPVSMSLPCTLCLEALARHGSLMCASLADGLSKSWIQQAEDFWTHQGMQASRRNKSCRSSHGVASGSRLGGRTRPREDTSGRYVKSKLAVDDQAMLIEMVPTPVKAVFRAGRLKFLEHALLWNHAVSYQSRRGDEAVVKEGWG